jgi:hypothetical protein
MQCEANPWIIAGQLATPVVVAIIGGYFAYQQAATARKKLRLDHYDKRFAVFNAARTLLGRVLALGEAKIEDQQAFLAGTVGATFLFKDPGLSTYLDELIERAHEIRFLQNDLEKAHDDADREKARRAYTDARQWLRDQYKVLEEKFRPHLQLYD